MDATSIFGAAQAVLLLIVGGGFGLPLGVPPGPEDPLLAKVAPDECVYYSSWAGIVAPDPDSPNDVEQLLAEPEVQQLLQQIEERIVSAVQQAAAEEGDEAQLIARLAPDLIKALFMRPAAVFVSRAGLGAEGLDISAALVVNLGEKQEAVEAALEKLQSTLLGPAVQEIQLGGKPAHRIQLGPVVPPVDWTIAGNYLVVGFGEDAVTGVFERVRTDAPPWLVELKSGLSVERTSTMSYINIEKLVATLAPLGGQMAAAAIQATGLGNVQSLASVTGLEGTGFVGRSLLQLDGDPAGLLRIVAGAPLTADDLAPIPADSTLALAVRLDGSKVLDVLLEMVGEVEPRARDEIAEGLKEMGDELGIDVRGDVLSSLGDVWCAYNSPGEGGLVLTGLTATVTVKDRDRLVRVHDRLLGMLKSQLGGPDDGGFRRRGPRLNELKVAGQDVFVLTGIDEEFPFAPSWCLTDTHLVFALFPQNITALLNRGNDFQSLATAPQVKPLLEEGEAPSMIFYQDTPELFKLAYPMLQMVGAMASSELQREGVDVDVSLLPSARSILPHLKPGVTFLRRSAAGIEFETRQSVPGGNVGATLPLAVGLGVPAVFSARGAARRMQSTNNMRQFAIAMLNHEAEFRGFPAAYTSDDDGKPLLSWRVRMLPYLDQQPLYESFHLDEPWDSEHNKKLISAMPDIFASPGGSTEPGMTHFQTVRGTDTIFPGKDPVQIAAIRDGTSHTILIVEADKPVIWTKPDDFQYDPDNPMKGLGTLRREGFNAVFADGHSRRISPEIDPEMLRRMFTKGDGKPVEHP